MYHFIPQSFSATLLTPCIATAFKYCEHATMEVVQVGDRLLKASKIAVGGEAITKIRQVRANMCILDVSAIDSQRGLTESDWQLAQIKKAMVECSDVVVCLARSAAIGRIATMQICALPQLTYLITDLDPIDPSLAAYRARGIIVL
jgi:DeoR/GlpR family transcriptional regulator of sugar metabolism